MHVQMTPELERLLQQQLDTGRYDSVSHVMCDALRLMAEIDRDEALRRDDIRSQITQGMKSIRRGDLVDGEALFDRLEAELDAAKPHDSV